jgi:hypothetical protein
MLHVIAMGIDGGRLNLKPKTSYFNVIEHCFFTNKVFLFIFQQGLRKINEFTQKLTPEVWWGARPGKEQICSF